MKSIFMILLAGAILSTPVIGQYKSDVIKTSEGELEMFFIGHGTLMFKFNELVIHIDPWMNAADYATMPDADLILVTHEHGDHLDMTAIKHVLRNDTRVVMTRTCAKQLRDVRCTLIEMMNGEGGSILDIGVRAIPAYNIEHTRTNGDPYHPKGVGNGYILSFGETNVLIGGDTENIPEYKNLGMDIHVAFLPMNLPYTMTPEMVADAAMDIQPGILYPYHFGQTDPQELVKLLIDEKDIEVRVRDLK